MEDTDSMAIVATKDGGEIPCPGGPRRMRDGQSAINALSWDQVDQIVQQFASLNPYDKHAIPESVLKIEDVNYDAGKRRQQLYCFAISAKRYALFVRRGNQIELPRYSEHGLGHLLNPSALDSDNRNWIKQVWLSIIRRALNLPTPKLGFESLPAIGRLTVSSPAMAKPLTDINNGRKYSEQIKPFNFLLTCHVMPLGHPVGTDAQHFHLVSPYETNPSKWKTIRWIDQYTGNSYRIKTDGYHGDRQTARVKTYGDVLREYEFHPEAKCADRRGTPCEKQTVGLLQRRHIRVDLLKYIGKESNSIEEVDAGLVHSEHNVYTEYSDPKRDEWAAKTLVALRGIGDRGREKFTLLAKNWPLLKTQRR